MAAALTLRYEDDTENPIATKTAVVVEATDVDITDPVTDAEIRHYISAEHGSHDAARSPVFSGDYSWLGWIAPAEGTWTFHLRAVADDAAAAQAQATFDAP